MPGDLLLAGGLVVDGSGGPTVTADVLVRAGRVAAIGSGLSAQAVRDVTGRVVCPGFVDIHTHSDLTLLSDPRALSAVHQGVTTEVVGNCGLSVAPLAPGAPVGPIRQAVGYLDLDPAVDWSWPDLNGYLAVLAAAGPGVNVAALVGHLALHASVVGFADRAADPAEIDRMRGLLGEAFDAGAVGLSTGLVYAPLPYVRDAELLALASVVADRDRIFTWHVRNYDDELLDSVGQAVRIARATGARTQISHLAAVGRRNWGAVRRALDLVDAANADGFDVGVDIYPYLHGNAPLSQLLPAYAQEGGPEAWAPRLRDPALRAEIRAAWLDRPTGWDELTLSWTSRPAPDPVVGRSIAALAEAAGVDAADLVLDLLAELGNGVLMTAGGRSDDDLRTVLGHPAAVVASDGLALDPGGVTGAGVPHPRSYGTFPRFLHRYATDLPDAVRRCTSAPATRVGLHDRGLLRPGAPADVVVFDPARLTDRATFTAPHQFAAGIDLVLVNGVVTVDGGAHTGSRAGNVLTTSRA
ncbi:D-aminoacylase [Plantactinospora sp. S1510]|uniref:D-aminoacylase n=1 Tax=Plantactinospora alkalitolerans TaxID=2789879 RepID=A0ABS0GTX9_9ACTN|nr:D-aminoacylase [Plantactinospora alkalitolerans]MBF9129640.1 D-aminoacylase [Plantactinospora alkalitolerans]